VYSELYSSLHNFQNISHITLEGNFSITSKCSSIPFISQVWFCIYYIKDNKLINHDIRVGNILKLNIINSHLNSCFSDQISNVLFIGEEDIGQCCSQSKRVLAWLYPSLLASSLTLQPTFQFRGPPTCYNAINGSWRTEDECQTWATKRYISFQPPPIANSFSSLLLTF
jgi:hypothetical protein